MDVVNFRTGRGRYVGINLDELTAADFQKIKGRLKNVRDHVLFDSIRLNGAQVWNPGSFKAFTIANGQTQQVTNQTALTYVKDDSDTNLVGNGGQLPSGDFFIVQSIMLKLATQENEFTTQLSNTATVNPTPINLAANTAVGGANQVLCITENVVLKFWVDDTRLYENGTLDYFPQGFGYSGWAGQQQAGLAQNGGVLPRMLARPRHLRELQRFFVELIQTKTLTVPVSSRLKVGFWGALYVPVG